MRNSCHMARSTDDRGRLATVVGTGLAERARAAIAAYLLSHPGVREHPITSPCGIIISDVNHVFRQPMNPAFARQRRKRKVNLKNGVHSCSIDVGSKL